jgi:hypothetical protein
LKAKFLAQAAASVTFSAIPATYTDLVLRVMLQEQMVHSHIRITFNGTTAPYYSRIDLNGSGASCKFTLASTRI